MLESEINNNNNNNRDTTRYSKGKYEHIYSLMLNIPLGLCVFWYISMCVYLCVYIFVNMHVCIFMYILINVHVLMCMYIYIMHVWESK